MTTDDQALEQRARELYPQNEYLQQQWLRSVRLVRTTAHGWCLDPPPVAAAVTAVTAVRPRREEAAS